MGATLVLGATLLMDVTFVLDRTGGFGRLERVAGPGPDFLKSLLPRRGLVDGLSCSGSYSCTGCIPEISRSGPVYGHLSWSYIWA